MTKETTAAIYGMCRDCRLRFLLMLRAARAANPAAVDFLFVPCERCLPAVDAALIAGAES